MPSSSDIHSFYLSIEDKYSLRDWQNWCSQRNNWPILVIPIYLLAIIYGKNLMRDRKPFHVKSLLFLWNAGLALFSIIGTIRLFANIKHQISEHGFRDSVCVNRPDNVVALWVYLFTMSKFAELGDTFFLVIRQRKVLFLHWYHHVTVLLYTWFAFTHDASTGKYFIVMNFFVHSLMYTYFALQTIGIKAPKLVSMSITSLQILQMIGGISVLSMSIYQINFGSGCSVHSNIILSGVLMYGSYFALFVQFFIQSYFKSQTRKSSSSSASVTTAVPASDKSAEGQAPDVDMNRNHIKSL